MVRFGTLEVMCEAAGVCAVAIEPRAVFDAAAVGVVQQHGRWVVAYDRDQVLELTARENAQWDRIDVLEWVGFNVAPIVALVDL